MNKKTIIIIAIVIIVAFMGMKTLTSTSGIPAIQGNSIKEVYSSLTPQAKSLYYKQSEELTKAVPERLVELDELKIGCFGPKKVMSMSSTESNLGGQCCGALKDFEAYELQLESLQEFIEAHGDIEIIPKDPYDVSVTLAQELTEYDALTLSSSQQKIYDDSLKISHHGPCCCKCWKWYVMSGLGKKLIIDFNFNAEDVAELWDLSSSCGHAEDTNMAQHYGTEKTHSHD